MKRNLDVNEQRGDLIFMFQNIFTCESQIMSYSRATLCDHIISFGLYLAFLIIFKATINVFIFFICKDR